MNTMNKKSILALVVAAAAIPTAQAALIANGDLEIAVGEYSNNVGGANFKLDGSNNVIDVKGKGTDGERGYIAPLTDRPLTHDPMFYLSRDENVLPFDSASFE